MRNRLLAAVTALATTVSVAGLNAAAPPGFTETTYVNDSDLSPATGMAWAPDGSNRLFVTVKTGTVRIVKDGALLPTAFAAMPAYTNSECGLIGMCFDPDYLNNRFVYFFVTNSDSSQQIVRYVDDNNVGKSRTVLLNDLPTDGENHDGGGIGIGPDGHLYWAIGDLGNGSGVDDDLESLAAKVGRANRFTGTPVPNNPFHDGGGPNNDFIWARGFRNPFTLTFHPASGDLWVNVVGTGQEQVFLVNRGDHAGYNNYENNQPTGYLLPKIAYRTNGTDTRTFTASGAARSANITTFTTTGNHRFRTGQQITVADVNDASFNGTFFVQSVLTPTTFTVPQVAPDATSGGGSAETADLGGCITGGAFYDSTLFAPEYRGNFFFGDYNSAQIIRATISANTNVTSVSTFATGSGSNVDVTVGPDGALYYLGVRNDTIKRLAPTTLPDALVVQPTAIRVQEGGRSLFTVRLAKQPAAPVTVQISKRLGGDAELGANGTTLTFTEQNWNQLQSVEIAAGLDTDDDSGNANFDLTATGYDTQSVLATEIEGPTDPNSASDLLYYTDGPVPGEGEETVFKSFGLPSFDGPRIGFLATTQSSAERIPVIFGGETPGVLVRKNGPAPGTDGTFAAFKDPVFGGNHYAFIGKLKSGSGVNAQNDDGIWSDASGSLQLVAREGSEAPGAGGALFHKFVSIALPALGDGLFVAQLRPGTGAGADRVKSTNDYGIWRASVGGSVLVLREGAPVEVQPGSSRTVKKFQTLGYVKGSEDQRRSHTAEGNIHVLVDFTDGTQAIIESPGNGDPLIIKAITGQGVTEPAGEILAKLGVPAANSAAIAFRATLAFSANTNKGNDTALFAQTEEDTFASITREGDPAASTGDAQFADFSAPAISSDDRTITFHASLRLGTGDPVVKAGSDTGLWTTMGGSLKLIAREGLPAAGTNGHFTKFHSFAVNPDSETQAIAFTAELRLAKGQATARNRSGLWAFDRNGDLHLLQRTGDSIFLPGSATTEVISQFALKSPMQSPGQGRALNELGQVVFLSKFKRGGQGIFVAQLPTGDQ
jgi:glucose/arabinose dehydrogenase